MEKVIWNENYIEYFYSKREPYWLKDYFKISIKSNNGDYMYDEYINTFEIIDDKKLKIEGNFNPGDILEVDGIQYICKKTVTDNATQTDEDPQKFPVDDSTQTEPNNTSDVGVGDDSIDNIIEPPNVIKPDTSEIGIGTDNSIAEESEKKDAEVQTEDNVDIEENNSEINGIGLDNEGHMILTEKKQDSSKTQEIENINNNKSTQTEKIIDKTLNKDIFSKEYENLKKLQAIDFANLKIVSNDNIVYILNPSKQSSDISINVNEYTKETYPEFAYHSYKNICNIDSDVVTICEVKKGTIIILTIIDKDENQIEIEYENTPLYHYSTVNALKDFIKDLEIGLVLKKDDDFYKNLISEKSLYMKKRFGLTEDQTMNIEFFPIFKYLVNLYCVQSMISYSFIQGKPIVEENGQVYHNKDLKLGKFKTDGDFETGSLFGPDAIKNALKQAEQDLFYAINNKAYVIHHNLKQKFIQDVNIKNNLFCGCYLKYRILNTYFKPIRK